MIQLYKSHVAAEPIFLILIFLSKFACFFANWRYIIFGGSGLNENIIFYVFGEKIAEYGWIRE
jgi:hypothetical protein